jgi:zinc D-Ala-D-Ala carboxypeptidase
MEALMPTAMLSEHFSLAEMIYSETASRQGLDNEPDVEAFNNLKTLCEVLEKVRTICGDNAVTILSGYRSPEVNAAVGGSSTSAHMIGLAADFIIPSCGDPLTICQMIEQFMEALGIDQLIWEYGDWVHLGLCVGTPRCQCLTINNQGTTEGFPDV